jgi:hypothetical protein
MTPLTPSLSPRDCVIIATGGERERNFGQWDFGHYLDIGLSTARQP